MVAHAFSPTTEAESVTSRLPWAIIRLCLLKGGVGGGRLQKSLRSERQHKNTSLLKP